jgi:hypothetical protein
LNLAVPDKITLKVVVADPFGRKSESLVSFTKPVVAVEIGKIAVTVSASAANVAFLTNVGKAKPAVGQNTLNILLHSQTDDTTRLLFTIAFQAIPDSFPFFPNSNAMIAGGTVQDPNGFFRYEAVFRGTVNLKAFAAARGIIISITDAKGKITEVEKTLP